MDQHEMDEFEHRLASELRPVSAPDGFTARVLARQRRGRVRRAQAWLAAAVLLGMLSVGAVVNRQYRQHAQEQAARQQFDLAMQVTGRTLYQAEQAIRGIDVTSIEVQQ